MGKAKKNTPKPRKRGKAGDKRWATTPEQVRKFWEQFFGDDARIPRNPLFGDYVHIPGNPLFDKTAVRPAQLPSVASVRKSGKEWISDAFGQRRDELLRMGITDASRALAYEPQTAPDTKPMKPRSADKLLRNLDLWRKANRGSKQRPK